MSWLRTILHEVFGLFVDDGSFAIAILVWLGIVLFLLPRPGYAQESRGIVLFAGLGIILVESAMRYSRRKRS